MTSRRWDGFAIASIAAAAAVTALVYERLPDPLPTHFDLSGRPNGWMPRPIGAWGIPAFALVLWAIVRYARRVLPRRDRERLSESVAAFVAAITAAFIASVHVIVLYVALVPGSVITRPVLLLVGAFFVALGLVMPRVRRNPIVGVRTAWTLRSDENWARTHRVAGYAMVLAGIVGGLAGASGGEIGGVVAIAAFVLAGLVPAAYSFFLARAEQG
jgi:uncharacterized membrane protein